MIKSLTLFILILILIQNPNSQIKSLALHTSERTIIIEREALSHLIKLKSLGRGKVSCRFLRGTDRFLRGTDLVETGWGL